MITLNPQQINELLNIVDSYHLLFMARNVGADLLSDEDKRVLINSGVDLTKLKQISKVEEAFAFGMIAQALGDKRAKTMTYANFKKFMQSGAILPFTAAEKFAIASLRNRMSTDLRNQSNRIKVDFKNTLSELEQKSRKRYIETIKQGAEEVLMNRGSVRDLSSWLGHKTKDWGRDFDRIADYVMHTAMDNGIAMQILKENGENAMVWKQVYLGACKHCVSAYLTNGIGSEPKLFKLGDLIENGSNIGVKTNEWKPIIGAHHVYCRCQLRYKPEDRAWNDKEQGFTTVLRNKQGVKRTGKAVINITQ